MQSVKLLVNLPMVGPFWVQQDPDPSYEPAVPNDALDDESDATYIDVKHYIGGAGVFHNRAIGDLAPGWGDPRSVVNVYARLKADGAIEGVSLFTHGSGAESRLDPAGTPVETPVGTLYPMDSLGIDLVNNVRNGFATEMQIIVPATRTDTAIFTRIYEASIVVALIGVGEAPPCRRFPRPDRLGVGGGRRFPPPASLQESNRRFGYY